MKKRIILAFALALSLSLYAFTYTVGLDPSLDFQSIQSAIDNAVNGDSIIVHPGIYYENIDFLEKSLFLGSLFSLTADTTYISQTIIDGQKQSNVITMIDVDEATVEGFTIQNGHANRQAPYHGYVSENITNGGGVKIINFYYKPGGLKILSNNIIKNNYANFGGGVWSVGSQVHFRGNKIYRNSAITDGGGLFYDPHEIGGVGKNTPASIEINEVSVFSSEDKNSVYYNTSSQFNDIRFNRAHMLDVPLKIGTYAQNTWFQIGNVNASAKPLTINVTIEEAFIDVVDADLYVSPDGDDSNSGLSPNEPLKTISMALFKHKGNIFEQLPSQEMFYGYLTGAYPASQYINMVDSLNVKAIYVANGVYNEEAGNLFPLRTKNHIKIIGESQQGTVIDCRGKNHAFVAGFDSPTDFIWYEEDDFISYYHPYTTPSYITIENLTIKNTFNDDYCYGGGKSVLINQYPNGCANIYSFKNIKYTDTELENSGAGYIHIPSCYMTTLSNIQLVHNNNNPASFSPFSYAIFLGGWLRYGILENVIIDGGKGGVLIDRWSRGRVLINNLLVKNLHSTDMYSDLYAIEERGGYYENDSSFPLTRISNSTFYNNSLIGPLISVSNHVNFNMYNNILYGTTGNVIMLKASPTVTSVISNNLFEFSQAWLLQNNPGWQVVLENNIFSQNPLFIGEGEHPEMLSFNSPARDSGTLNIPAIPIVYPFYDLSTYEISELDLVGNPMVVNGLINMGAYAYYATGNSNEEAMPLTSQLYSNYPNPFNPETNIRYYLNSDSNVSLEVFNIKGQKVKTLDKGFRKTGEYLLTWNGTDDNNRSVGSGIYFYRLKTESFSSTQKMILLK